MPLILLLAIPVLAVTATMKIYLNFYLSALIMTLKRNDWPEPKNDLKPVREANNIILTYPTCYKEAFSSQHIIENDVLLLSYTVPPTSGTNSDPLYTNSGVFP